MKKLRFRSTCSFMFLAFLAACGPLPTHGPGGRNACEYVREQFPDLRDNIKSVEIIAEDSTLSDLPLTFANLELARAGSEYVQGLRSVDDYSAVIDSFITVYHDVAFSWQYGDVINDSLGALSKYNYEWRKVYKIRITMKSSTTKDVRVLMDADGITPRAIDSTWDKIIEDYYSSIIDAQSTLIEFMP